MSDMECVFETRRQGTDWVWQNCDRCTRMDGGQPVCEIEAAVVKANEGDGAVPSEIAARMGFYENMAEYAWDCSERKGR